MNVYHIEHIWALRALPSFPLHAELIFALQATFISYSILMIFVSLTSLGRIVYS